MKQEIAAKEAYIRKALGDRMKYTNQQYEALKEANKELIDQSSRLEMVNMELVDRLKSLSTKTTDKAAAWAAERDSLHDMLIRTQNSLEDEKRRNLMLSEDAAVRFAIGDF